MTKVLCCWVDMHPATLEALMKHVPEAEVIELDRHSPADYYLAISDRWAQDDLIILEPDMGITSDTIPSLAGCKRDWCAWGYLVPWYPDTRVPQSSGFIRTIHSLGATKISLKAQLRTPWSSVWLETHVCLDECGGGWWHLDKHIAQALIGRAYRPHDHGDIAHFHDYSSPLGLTPLKEEKHTGTRSELIDILKKRGWHHPERMSVFNESGNQGS